jgi:hypothetical protein
MQFYKTTITVLLAAPSRLCQPPPLLLSCNSKTLGRVEAAGGKQYSIFSSPALQFNKYLTGQSVKNKELQVDRPARRQVGISVWMIFCPSMLCKHFFYPAGA